MLAIKIQLQRLPSVSETVASRAGSPPMATKAKERLQRSRPRTMKGMERRRIARRPMVSIQAKATRVRAKFVRAMLREARIGEVKPT